MSPVTCHMEASLFLDEVVELVCGGSISTAPTSSSFKVYLFTYSMCLFYTPGTDVQQNTFLLDGILCLVSRDNTFQIVSN